MSEDLEDDWFERALQERESETDDGEEGAGGDRTEDGNGDRAEESDSGRAEEGIDAAKTEGADETNDSSSSLFDEGFGSALDNVQMPDVGVETAPPGDVSTGPDGFDDLDFDLGGSEETDFEADVDSELPRIDLGIDGLDRMIQGGVPERTLMVAMGPAGTGKTTFGLQFLHYGLESGESAVFITLEESRERVINSATEKGYPFEEYVETGQLAVVGVDPIEMANSLTSIRNDLPRLIEDFGASRLVLDSVSLLEMMYEERAKRRNEIYDFTRSLKEAGVTAMLTSEVSETSPYASRYGIVEYLTDAVFVLQYVRPDDFRETRLAIEIQKIRDANHSREKKPYEITGEGLSVYQQANLF
ncbi:KaiC domain-containing protein [Natronosalvus halobius]|uniref:KaiC domain-containing protein n=1 Tax=Natronosalvus halobius TaxID=2953746 RepID=UPI0020A21085|nr:KaiC domain-containing protein [Natronosalvus halobius]USZ70323.1 KaiC domain-containing protein [Natronosalvus halobius]